MSEKISGWLVINKPAGFTSAQMVWKVKKIIKILDKDIKIGHTGTLDPFATGILPMAINEATKLVNIAMDSNKEYLFTIKFGAKTDTGDLEGNIIETINKIPTKDEIIKVIPEFIGEIMQMPPKYSAIKINGQRSYDLARKNIDFELNARLVTIYSLELLDFKDDMAYMKVICGKGTYVRSLASDIACKVGSLGYVTELHRSKVGKFDNKNTILLDSLQEIVHNGELVKYLLPIDLVLDDILVLEVEQHIVMKIRYGQPVYFVEHIAENCQIAVKSNNILIAIGYLENGNFKSQRVFNI
jgi:tRNA pseudouridine55 synthase